MSKEQTKLEAIPTDLTSSAKCVIYSEIEARVQWLVGNLLTMIDATITDPIQRKAFKDLVKNKVRDWQYEQVNAVIENVLNLMAKQLGDFIPERDRDGTENRQYVHSFTQPIGFKYSRVEV